MKAINNPSKVLAAYLIIGLFLIAISRLPQLCSGILDLDSDEAVVALMAKHISEGKSLPVFFYGQHYGLSLIEAATGALFFQLFGTSTISLKAAMLLLWATGWVFFVLAVRKFADMTTTCIAGCLLIFCPAWGIWSMMARGGYVTAFMLTNICLWIFSRLYQSKHPAKSSYALLGICIGTLYLAQPISLLSFSPFLVLLLWKHRSITSSLMMALGILATIGVIFLLAAGYPSSYWSPNFLFRKTNIIQALRFLPERIWIFFSGVYFLFLNEFKRGFFTIISASLWSLAFFLAPVLVFHKLIKGKHFAVTYASFFSITLVTVFTLLIRNDLFGCRYLLPIAGMLVFFFFAESVHLCDFPRNLKMAIITISIFVMLFGGMSLIEARNYSRSWTITYDSINVDAKDELIKNLLANGIHHVYCIHPMFKWNIIWDSAEQVIARSMRPSGRYPKYERAVDSAFFSGEKVAIVGMTKHLKHIRQIIISTKCSAAPAEIINGCYFWIPDPNVELLRNLGFSLNDPNQLFTPTEKSGTDEVKCDFYEDCKKSAANPDKNSSHRRKTVDIINVKTDLPGESLCVNNAAADKPAANRLSTKRSRT
jgi:hypothetical protein